jgi:hypothetical protein
MTDLENVTNATERVEQAKRLIREAQSARQPNELSVRTSRAEIDRTRRASEAMANLAHLIDEIVATPRE